METLCPTSVVSNSSWYMHQGNRRTAWTQEENKAFESALAIFDENTPNRWFEVASLIPGKSVHDVMNQYKELVADVSDIEAGLVPVPGYLASPFTWELAEHRGFDVYRKRGRTCDQERKKGVPWTEEEHRRFLLGLEKHGKGDWRNISRNFVVSKTPTQVASHAQKYYLRQLSGAKDKRRPSIHDITTIHMTDIINTQTDNNSSSSSSRICLLDNKSDDLFAPMQKSTNTPLIVVDWARNNDGGLVAFESDSYVAYPRDIATRVLYH